MVEFSDFISSLPQLKQNIIVSCFYQIDNKHTQTEFNNWISNFLCLSSLKFIFTDKSTLFSLFESSLQLKISPIEFPDTKLTLFCNIDNKIVFAIMPLTETFIWEHFSDYMIYSKSIDIERLDGLQHNEMLYTIWNNKSWFLLETVYLTQHFDHLCNGYYWVDIGSIRTKPTPQIQSLISSFNFVNRLSTKMIFMLIESFEEMDFEMINDVPIIFQNNCIVNRIEGGFFGGGPKEIYEWCNLYYQELSLFQHLKLFGGKDQYIMSSIIMKNHQLYDICPSEIKDKHLQTIADLLQLSEWFYYICLFSDIKVHE
jgi:hypothetical protein